MPAPTQPLVLVVEDSDDVREALEAFLLSRRYRVVTCDRPESALAAMRVERPDLVLTDIFLGPSSGLDLITAIRSDFADPPPLIACSGMAGVERAALARGAQLFLIKPLVADALERAMAALLRARAPEREVLEENTRRSRELRARHVDAALEARAKIAPHAALLVQQAERDARWLPAFLGGGDALVATVQGEQLLVAASSDPRRWPRGYPIANDLPLCRDILETGSSFLVPDLAALAPSLNPGAGSPRFVAAFPFSYDHTPVGVLCLLGDQPGRLDPADFGLVGELCDHLSAWLSDERRPAPRGSSLMRRGALEAVTRTEFDRAARQDLTVHVFVFSGSTPPADLLSERTLVADLGEGRYGLMMTRPSSDHSPAELVAAVRRFRELPGFTGGELLSIEVCAAPRLGNDVLRIVEQRFKERAARTPTARIDRIVVRHEALDHVS